MFADPGRSILYRCVLIVPIIGVAVALQKT